MLEILTDITNGKGRKGDIERLEETAETMKAASLCGLGKTAANPVLSTIKYFRDEYEAHIKKNICPAGICPNLTSFFILKDKCKACGLCKKSCPTAAIRGEKARPHVINQKLCVNCGSCRNACPFGAVETKGNEKLGKDNEKLKNKNGSIKKAAAKKITTKKTINKKPIKKAMDKKPAKKAAAKKPAAKAAIKKPTTTKPVKKPVIKKPIKKSTVKKPDVKKSPAKKTVKKAPARIKTGKGYRTKGRVSK